MTSSSRERRRVTMKGGIARTKRRERGSSTRYATAPAPHRHRDELLLFVAEAPDDTAKKKKAKLAATRTDFNWPQTKRHSIIIICSVSVRRGAERRSYVLVTNPPRILQGTRNAGSLAAAAYRRVAPWYFVHSRSRLAIEQLVHDATRYPRRRKTLLPIALWRDANYRIISAYSKIKPYIRMFNARW